MFNKYIIVLAAFLAVGCAEKEITVQGELQNVEVNLHACQGVAKIGRHNVTFECELDSDGEVYIIEPKLVDNKTEFHIDHAYFPIIANEINKK